MIKSTKVSLKFSNKNKLDKISSFVDEYTKIVRQFVDIFWELADVPTLAPKEISSKIETNLTARMIQCAGKQASGIVRGCRKKQSKRLYMIKLFNKQGKFKKARKLQRIYDNAKVSKPKIVNICPELDQRFVSIFLDKTNSFDCWIVLKVTNRQSIKIPFRKTSHFNKLSSLGQIKKGLRLSKDSATLMFDIPEVEKRSNGSILGIDIGLLNTLSCSDGQQSQRNKHGHNLDTISKILSRKKKGSKGFRRTQGHRTNYINWSINQLNLTNIKQVNIEDIKRLRYKKRSSRALSHWTYTDIFRKLEGFCQEQGVLVNKMNPTYTSQRCAECGWIRKSNRKGKQFKCGNCGHKADSDLNASRNLALSLDNTINIVKKRLKHDNRKGFFWSVEGQESIVPDVQEPKK